MSWLRGGVMWGLAGALMGFGVVGFLTGLILVPFGLVLAFSLIARRAPGIGFLLVGLGAGPVVLLFDDLNDGTTRPSGAIGGFQIGAALIALGIVGVGVQLTRHLRATQEPSG